MRPLFALLLLVLPWMSQGQDSVVIQPCKACFTFQVNYKVMSLLPATVLDFTDCSTGNVSKWFWEFGNGQTSDQQNPTIIFNHPYRSDSLRGEKINPYVTVSLTILTANGCKSYYAKTFNIYNPLDIDNPVEPDDPRDECLAHFKYLVQSYDTLSETAQVQFFNGSVGENLAFTWKFGDGTISNDSEPVHAFSHFNAGQMVCLSVENANGCSASYCDSVWLYDPWIDPGQPNDPPTDGCRAHFKNFVLSYDSLNDMATVQFGNGSQGNNPKFTWQFGDGTTSNEPEPIHSFPASERLATVCLLMTDDNGCSATYCDTVWISDPGNHETNPGDQACKVYFGYQPNTTVKTFAPALVLDFFPKSNEEIVKVLWDFGDGTSSDEFKPTHIFNLPVENENSVSDTALFSNVCLTVTTVSGCEASWCETIWLKKREEPKTCYSWFSYRISKDDITIPELKPYRFTVGSSGKIDSVTWYFEDGSISHEFEPLVLFDIFVPIHKVGVSTISVDGCISYYSDLIYIESPADSTNEDGDCNYFIDIRGEYPIWASACIGTATARLLNSDSLEVESKFVWSTGLEGPLASGLCPTHKYGVIAYAYDGCKVTSNFVFNSDGSVSGNQPGFWWADGKKEDTKIHYNTTDSSYTAYWVLCDGTVIKSDSIELNKIDCESAHDNLIVKDSRGNVVYSETIGNNIVTSQPEQQVSDEVVLLFPNPVKNLLNIAYKGEGTENIDIEIYSSSGQVVFRQFFSRLSQGDALQVDLSLLTEGVYFCRLRSGDVPLFTQKIRKIR